MKQSGSLAKVRRVVVLLAFAACSFWILCGVSAPSRAQTPTTTPPAIETGPVTREPDDRKIEDLMWKFFGGRKPNFAVSSRISFSSGPFVSAILRTSGGIEIDLFGTDPIASDQFATPADEESYNQLDKPYLDHFRNAFATLSALNLIRKSGRNHCNVEVYIDMTDAGVPPSKVQPIAHKTCGQEFQGEPPKLYPMPWSILETNGKQGRLYIRYPIRSFLQEWQFRYEVEEPERVASSWINYLAAFVTKRTVAAASAVAFKDRYIAISKLTLPPLSVYFEKSMGRDKWKDAPLDSNTLLALAEGEVRRQESAYHTENWHLYKWRVFECPLVWHPYIIMARIERALSSFSGLQTLELPTSVVPEPSSGDTFDEWQLQFYPSDLAARDEEVRREFLAAAVWKAASSVWQYSSLTGPSVEENILRFKKGALRDAAVHAQKSSVLRPCAD